MVSCYELGHPPFGVALLSGFLERAGFLTDTLDLSVSPLSNEKLCCAKLIGISVPMHTALRIGVKVAEHARKVNPHCKIVFFGLYASLNADFLLDRLADFVIGGAVEEAFVKCVESLTNGVRPPRISADLRLHSCATPSRATFPPLSLYAQLEKNGTHDLAGYVEASRGCRHSCRHCPIPPVYDGRFTIIPEEILLEDIGAQVALGAAHITFGDPDFLNGPNHSLKIVRQMHENFPVLTFDFTAK
ncbi:MAG: cobalamin B12-binding domain-containing protein, partial [Nitrospirae bacterium]|nr:cobalamin B12-binding domain-containing protein [Candidatus Troglogloeales bacterium]